MSKMFKAFHAARKPAMWGAWMVASSALLGCGGGGDEPTSPPGNVSPATAPGGLYVGSYQEDPATNPEDPTAGALYFVLPGASAAFSGSMYFTFFGCQSSNVGAISGSKTNTSLTGTWSGTVDGHAQNGAYTGSYDSANGLYSGTYSDAVGKQHISVANCIDYYIAPNGTWEVFPIGTSVPSSFVLNVSGTAVSWTPPTGTSAELLSVIDEAVALNGSANATKHQAIVTNGSFNLASVAGLTAGTSYVVQVTARNNATLRVGVASARVTR